MSGDTSDADLRAALHRAADMIANYLGGVEEYPVRPATKPGEVRDQLPAAPPSEGETLDSILDDFDEVVLPNTTHWNHPGFLAYFGISGSGPGILGESLAASLNVNAMLWRTSPVATEMEEVVCDWLRQMVGLPEGWFGHINDTASIGTLLALVAARHRCSDLEVDRKGLAGRPEVPPLVVYASDQAHSAADKAAIALGLGLNNLRRLESDDQYRFRPEALKSAIADDRRAGRRPMAVIATAGTTSTTSVDPIEDLVGVCRSEEIWLHVDAAYAGAAAICPEFRPLFKGWELADSIVINPHKWLFTPKDCSVLMVRDVAHLRSTFSIVPEYLRTPEGDVTNLMDLGVQLGRRFRALKLWMVIRAFGVEGLRQRIRDHCQMASRLAAQIESHSDFEVVAPVKFSVVCFRWNRGETGAERNQLNERLLEGINSEGPVFLSHTVLGGEFAIRVAIGNLGTTSRHLDLLWEMVRRVSARIETQL